MTGYGINFYEGDYGPDQWESPCSVCGEHCGATYCSDECANAKPAPKPNPEPVSDEPEGDTF